jgi:NADP-dependent 3-hydroxy acid dehydrogenase YdfG
MARVLISGASQGLGRATAQELIRRGHDVIATARNVDTLADLDAVERLRLDVTDQASVDAAVKAAGRVDAFISNAGQTMRGSVESMPIDEVQRLFELNTLGALRVTQAVLPQMRERGAGRIIYVSSILGRIAIPMVSAYAASKWALEAIAESLAIEARPFGVFVSLLEPGRLLTTGPESAANFIGADDPYAAALAGRAGAVDDAITAEEAATVIVDALEAESPALRVPVGAAATFGLVDWRAAPTGEPFVWQPRVG